MKAVKTKGSRMLREEAKKAAKTKKDQAKA